MVESDSRIRINKCDKGNVLVLDVTDLLQDATADGVTDLLQSGLRVNVTQVNSAVSGLNLSRVHANSSEGVAEANVAGSSGGHSSRGHVMLLLLVLVLGYVSASVLTIVDSSSSPGRLSSEGLNDLDRSCNRQEMNEADVFVADDFDLIDRSVPAEVIPQALLSDGLLEVAEIDVPGGPVLLDSHYDVDRDCTGFSPSNLQFLSMELDLAHQSIRVKGGSRGRI